MLIESALNNHLKVFYCKISNKILIIIAEDEYTAYEKAKDFVKSISLDEIIYPDDLTQIDTKKPSIKFL